METIKVPSIEEFPKLAGIYKFTNKINGKIYIGETMNFKQRMGGHIARSYDENWTAVISKAFRKYGFSNFEYEIIESYPFGSVTKNFFIEREAFYIKELDAMNVDKGYNRCPYGANTIGYKFSEESRKKMSIARKGRSTKEETKVKKSLSMMGEKNWNYGKKMTDERKALLIKATTTREITEEERTNKSLGHLNSENKPRKPIYQLDKETGEILHTWRSLLDAARHLGKNNPSDIASSTLYPHKSAYGFKWRFLTEEEKKTAILETCHKEGFQCKRQTRYKRKLSNCQL